LASIGAILTPFPTEFSELQIYVYREREMSYIVVLYSTLYTIQYYIITLRIHAISLVESHDLLEDRRMELRHKFLKCRKYLKIPLNLYKLNEFMQLNL
jgi:hypothetical protein